MIITGNYSPVTRRAAQGTMENQRLPTSTRLPPNTHTAPDLVATFAARPPSFAQANHPTTLLLAAQTAHYYARQTPAPGSATRQCGAGRLPEIMIHETPRRTPYQRPLHRSSKPWSKPGSSVAWASKPPGSRRHLRRRHPRAFRPRQCCTLWAPPTHSQAPRRTTTSITLSTASCRKTSRIPHQHEWGRGIPFSKNPTRYPGVNPPRAYSYMHSLQHKALVSGSTSMVDQ